MVTIKKIICAVDLTDDYAPTVADYAATMGQAFDSEIIVCYVVPLFNTVMIDMAMEAEAVDNIISKQMVLAEDSMQKFLVDNFKNCKATCVVKEGRAAEEILDMAHVEKADLIVMGTRALTGVKRVLYGSVAEKVTKNATIPVLTITPGESSI